MVYKRLYVAKIQPEGHPIKWPGLCNANDMLSRLDCVMPGVQVTIAWSGIFSSFNCQSLG